VLLHSTDGKPLDDAETTAYATDLGKAEGVGHIEGKRGLIFLLPI
jgi:hypothetical protein